MFFILVVYVTIDTGFAVQPLSGGHGQYYFFKMEKKRYGKKTDG